MTYLLDTNALVWFETDDRRLGRSAARIISDAASDGLVSICPISFWEIEFAIARRRLTLSEPIALWRKRILASGFIERPITGEDTIAMAQLLDFHADPADRLITAVTINAGLTLITSDRKILDWTGAMSRIDLAV
jgi:PIN domain nuclease of toxin-antitoxin system